MRISALLIAVVPIFFGTVSAQTWQADNGNGTYSNPLFFDEFSDPDMIRVGADFYLTGTTMHSMPGLPVLRSRDLVNWTFVSYALDRLDLGPAYRLENGQNVYGQGIWAPCFRFHNGTFYIFSNVNKETTQLFRATNPAGPWTRTPMKRSFHDLSVLFDDDNTVWVVWGYRGIRLARLTDDFTDIVPGSEREIIPPSAGMGEGLHLYKVKGKYILTSAWYLDVMRMPTARADRLAGPWEVNQNVSRGEDFGLALSYRLDPQRQGDAPAVFKLTAPDPSARGRLAIHQGGIVDTPTGEWWGFSMMDANSIGRLTALSPVTWTGGWPYFGLPGNLGRSPRIWVKPNTGGSESSHAPYRRDDDFSGSVLQPVWQWNHIPVDGKWSLNERPGFLRLHALAAENLWTAHNTLTQRAVGPRSMPTVVMETTGMRPGDVAGFALFNRPYAWLGVERDQQNLTLAQLDEQTGQAVRAPLKGSRVWLRADCNHLDNTARFSYSADGVEFDEIGEALKMPYGLITFQGIRYAMFSYNRNGAEGGFADFDSFTLKEATPRGLTRPIPYGRQIVLMPHDHAPNVHIGISGNALVIDSKGAVPFAVVDRGLGRISLRSKAGFVSIDPSGAVTLRSGPAEHSETFQWIETFTGDLVLMSLSTNRYLRIDSQHGRLLADSPGPQPDGRDGVRFDWEPAADR